MQEKHEIQFNTDLAWVMLVGFGGRSEWRRAFSDVSDENYVLLKVK